MLYTAMTRRAMRIAYAAHAGQTDKSGVPYIFHPIHVAEQMHTETETVVALLHDVLEETAVTREELSAAGFSSQVLTALESLTRGRNEDYLEYIRRLAPNPLARTVKLADLDHNADPSRLETLTPKDAARLEKYRKAIALLREAERAF